MQVMQSNKWTFSLACFVMLLAIGFVVSTATAAVLGDKFATTLSIDDVSSEDGNQVEVGTVMVNIAFAKEVAFTAAAESKAFFGLDDITITIYDEDGLAIATPDTTALTRALSLASDAANTELVEANNGVTSGNFKLTLGGTAVAVANAGNTVAIVIARGAAENANRADVNKAATTDDTLGSNERALIEIELVAEEPDTSSVATAADPMVLSITQVDATPGFSSVGIRGPFSVQVLLSEMPKEFKADHIEVANGKVTSVITGAPIAVDAAADDLVTDASTTGRDNMAHPFLVMITPDLTKNDDIVISVKEFEDTVLPVSRRYRPDPVAQLDGDPAGTGDAAGNQKLELEVDPAFVSAVPDVFKPSADHLTANDQHLKALPEKAVIPANGYLVLAKGTDGGDNPSGIENSPAKPADKKRAAEMLYNIHYGFGLPFPADDLSNFFRNGGTLQLLHTDIAGNTAGADGDKGYGGATTGAAVAGSVIISEIMWGLDGDMTDAQYIELHNTTAADIGIDKNEWVISVGNAADTLYTTVVDTVGNNPATGFWEVPGTDGVSSVQQSAEFSVLVDIVSMSRVMGGTDGTAAASWAVSMRPSANLKGRRIGTPGAPNVYVMAPEPAPEPPPPPAPTTPIATASDIGITEIMVSTDGGRLPQWIELTNLSSGAVSLAGWNAHIENAEDEAVFGGGDTIIVDLSSLELGVGSGMTGDRTGAGEGQSALLVAWAAPRYELGRMDMSRVVNLATQLQPEDNRYQLLSYMGFKISLRPPQDPPVLVSGDVVGNLGADWDIPMGEAGRSSLIRMEMGNDGMATMGTSADGWRLASMTDLVLGPTSWYGSDEDAGTPGYDSGGPLPVELSSFYPKRNDAGQVVITWETQSELNNAGFFIKRSQQRDGKFVVINPTLIAGAGTTSEKQSYTYTDTTAQPNVVYYYQIEDVSLDGQRQTLTLGTRLRGHIGAAGKATTTWGELKSQE